MKNQIFKKTLDFTYPKKISNPARVFSDPDTDHLLLALSVSQLVHRVKFVKIFKKIGLMKALCPDNNFAAAILIQNFV